MRRLAGWFLMIVLAACLAGCCGTGCNSTEYGVSPEQPCVRDGGLGWR